MGKNYFENLDGLRFLAFFSVFLAHCFYSEQPYIFDSNVYKTFRFYGHLGIFGVNFFFVLSGYLITWLLIREYDQKGRINLRNFYARRILRIWPLYYAVVFIGFVLVPYVQRYILENDYTENAALWPYIIFVNNFFGEPNTAILGVLWSIAIEEQFYLFWPILVILFSRRLPLLFSSVIIVSFLARTFFIGYGYTHTLSCMSDLAVGSMLAYLSIRSSEFIEFFKKLQTPAILVIYIIGLTLFLLRSSWSEISYIYNNERFLFSLFFGFVIMEQNYSNKSLVKMSSLPWLTYWGQRSYGLYLLHFISIYILSKAFEILFTDSLIQTLLIRPFLYLAFSFLIAFVSYRYFEKYFLLLKRSFR